MSANKSTIFLTFTTLALAITSGYLFKCYSAEKSAKSIQISQNVQLQSRYDQLQNENVQLQIRYVDTEQQKNEVSDSIQQLTERNRQLNVSDHLGRLQQISNQLQELQNQLQNQNNRDIASELSQLNQLNEIRLTNAEQDRNYMVSELTVKIQNLRNEAINIVVGQIRTEAQAREYQRQYEILDAIVNEFASRRPDWQRFYEQANKFNDAFDNRMDELNKRIGQILGKIDNYSDDDD